MEGSAGDTTAGGELKRPQMNTREMQEYLLRFYKKRVASFLANLYKSSITGAMKDIHRTRLDVKKIYALFMLYELADPKGFSKRENYILFSKLFKRSGKIREIQINMMLLEGYGLAEKESELFREFLKDLEKRYTVRLLEEVAGFDEKKLIKTEKEIRNICRKMSKKKLILNGDAFIKNKAVNIAELQKVPENPTNLHKIRQELKAMSTVATLLFTVKPGDYLEHIIGFLNKTELLIGEWHDRVVFSGILKLYTEKGHDLSKELKQSLVLLSEEVDEEIKQYEKKFLPEVDHLAQFIRETSHDAKGRIIMNPLNTFA
jgi:CHAD domain-containing protein